MVDIHSHVLYGLDDGAKTFEESVEMLRLAAASGTTDLVCTPHANVNFKFDPPVIRERLVELQREMGDAVRLYSGCDFHLSYENVEDAIENPRKYTINRGGYLLVEFSEMLIFRNTLEIFARLQEAGMVPIVTHPERNGLLQQRLEEITKWVEAGALVQVTGQSLLGHFGRKPTEFARLLIDRRLVHFIASDGHDLKHRPPTMNRAYEWLVHNYGQAVADTLCIENPRAAVAGQLAKLTSGDEIRSRKWYRMWR